MNITEIKISNEDIKSMTPMLLLNDSRIAMIFNEKDIRILDPLNNFNCDIVLSGHLFLVSSLCQLDNGHLVSSSFDNSIIIWKLEKYAYSLVSKISDIETNFTCYVLALSDNRFAINCYNYNFDIYKYNKCLSNKMCYI